MFLSLKEEQRTAAKASLHGKDFLALLSTDIGMSLIHQLSLLAASPVVDLTGVAERWFVKSPAKYFLMSFLKQLLWMTSQMLLCDKPSFITAKH